MIVIGTRGSKLALVQAEWVSSQLEQRGLANRISILKTKGDLVQDRFDKMEGKGFFTKEIEDALLAGEIDLAVHCLKDLPTQDTPGLRISAIPEREDPFDVLVSAQKIPLNPAGYPELNDLNIGTSSNRRVASLAAHSPRAHFEPIRGNVPTRIAKMERGDVQAVVLAKAGLNRLNLDLSHLQVINLRPPYMIPAPGQGALALQVREEGAPDLSFLHHPPSAICVAAERRVLRALEGGCQLPLGTYVSQHEHHFHLQLFLAKKGKAPLHLHLEGVSAEALADEALQQIHAQR